MFGKLALLLLSALLLAPRAPAGEKVRAGDQRIIPPRPAVAPVSRAAPVAVTVSVVIQPAQPTEAPPTVTLRGLDGQVRRFAVEGGRQVIQVRPVVLRPGESVVLRWAPPK